MTPRRIFAALEFVSHRRRREFALSAKASLWGAQGDPKKTDKKLNELIKK